MQNQCGSGGAGSAAECFLKTSFNRSVRGCLVDSTLKRESLLRETVNLDPTRPAIRAAREAIGGDARRITFGGGGGSIARAVGDDAVRRNCRWSGAATEHYGAEGGVGTQSTAVTDSDAGKALAVMTLRLPPWCGATVPVARVLVTPRVSSGEEEGVPLRP